MISAMSMKQSLLRLFLKIYTTKQVKRQSRTRNTATGILDATIIISTFEKRFFSFTIPLIEALRSSTHIPITVVINGNYGCERDDEAYREFVTETQKYSNVSLVTFNTFRGWATLLNAGILHSDTDVSIVINDDIYVNPVEFEVETIVKEVEKHKLVLMNNSWSHFAINRSCLSTIGFFDEHFLGIGQEDGDYAHRFKLHYGFEVPALEISGLVNFVDTSRDESIAVTNGKYSLFNSVYLQIKMSQENAQAKFDWQVEAEGSLRTIYSWRFSLYKTLGWTDKLAIENEIQGIHHPRFSHTVRKK